MIGLAGGYIVALSLGMVDLEQISSAAWVGGPEPFKYGFTFSASAIISMSLVYIVVIAEATGDFMALGNNCQTQVSGKDLKRGLLGDRTAQQIADDLGGNVLDDQRNLMTPDRLASYRRQIVEFNAANA